MLSESLLSLLLLTLTFGQCFSQQMVLPEPENVTLNFASSNSALWSWDVPSSAFNLTGFMIFCRTERSKVIYSYEPDRRNILCQDLEPYTNYVFFVSSFLDDPVTKIRRFSKPGFLTGRTNTAAPSVARSLNVTLNGESKTLNVTWQIPEKWNGPLDGHVIKIVNSEGNVLYEATEKGFNHKFIFYLPLTPSSYFDVSIQYFNLDKNTGVDLFGQTLTFRFANIL